jgi:putative iron-regulated protein
MISIIVINKELTNMSFFKNRLTTLSCAAILSLSIGITGCGGGGSSSSNEGSITLSQKNALLKSYADSVQITMNTALMDAKALKTALSTFTDNPTQMRLDTAKAAWLKARESYGVTEIYRLSGGPIDAEEGWVADAYGAPEGQLNAWPLDENMIDYTIDESGATTSGNIIDSTGTFTPNGGTAIDITTLTKETLSALNENGGDANVATGYHAIEFLLWGQDQDYNSFIDDTITNGAMQAGMRVIEDYTSNAIVSKVFCKFILNITIVFQIFPRNVFSIQPLGVGINS